MARAAEEFHRIRIGRSDAFTLDELYAARLEDAATPAAEDEKAA